MKRVINEIKTIMLTTTACLNYGELLKVCSEVEYTYELNKSKFIYVTEEDTTTAFFEIEFCCMRGVLIRFPLTHVDAKKLKQEEHEFYASLK